MSEYAQGGYIGGDTEPPALTRCAYPVPVPVYLSPDECTVSREDVMAGRWVCSRAGHPTPTSDCTTGRGGMRRTDGTT